MLTDEVLNNSRALKRYRQDQRADAGAARVGMDPYRTSESVRIDWHFQHRAGGEQSRRTG